MSNVPPLPPRHGAPRLGRWRHPALPPHVITRPSPPPPPRPVNCDQGTSGCANRRLGPRSSEHQQPGTGDDRKQPDGADAVGCLQRRLGGRLPPAAQVAAHRPARVIAAFATAAIASGSRRWRTRSGSPPRQAADPARTPRGKALNGTAETAIAVVAGLAAAYSFGVGVALHHLVPAHAVAHSALSLCHPPISRV